MGPTRRGLRNESPIGRTTLCLCAEGIGKLGGYRDRFRSQSRQRSLFHAHSTGKGCRIIFGRTGMKYNLSCGHELAF